jgi:hypothetical protein
MYGADIFILGILGFYFMIATGCFASAAYDLYKWAKKKKRKRHLKLIKGGKYDDSHLK